MRRYPADEKPIRALPHIGWQEVVDDFDALRERYGFSSTRSLETFAELLRYLSKASVALERVEARSLEALDARSDDSAVSLREEAYLSIGREMEAWRRSRQVLDRTSEVMGEVIGRTEEHEDRRRLRAEHARSENDIAWPGFSARSPRCVLPGRGW